MSMFDDVSSVGGVDSLKIRVDNEGQDHPTSTFFETRKDGSVAITIRIVKNGGRTYNTVSVLTPQQWVQIKELI